MAAALAGARGLLHCCALARRPHAPALGPARRHRLGAEALQDAIQLVCLHAFGRRALLHMQPRVPMGSRSAPYRIVQLLLKRLQGCVQRRPVQLGALQTRLHRCALCSASMDVPRALGARASLCPFTCSYFISIGCCHAGMLAHLSASDRRPHPKPLLLTRQTSISTAV